MLGTLKLNKMLTFIHLLTYLLTYTVADAFRAASEAITVASLSNPSLTNLFYVA